MADEKEAVIEASASESPETSPVSEAPEGQDQPESAESAEVPSTSTETEENINSSPEDKKPSRQERRIKQLSRKLKEAYQDRNQAQPAGAKPEFRMPWETDKPEPLIRPEELETGVDPRELDRRFNQRLQEESYKSRNQVKAELRAEVAFESAVKEHIDDAEETAKALESEPTELDEYISEQYHNANYTIDPLTGKEIFLPRVKMSDLYKKHKAILEKKTASVTADIGARLHSSREQSAISPSGTGDTSSSHDDQAAFEQAKDTGDWKAVLKRRLYKK